jgi:hypothetical protein
MTPRYSSYWASKISARSGALGSPFGGGTRSTMRSSTAATPSPLFAETRSASVASMARLFSISSAISSGLAWGRSVLLRTGMISRFASIAR